MVGDGLTKGKNEFVPRIFLQEAFPKEIDYKGWEWILGWNQRLGSGLCDFYFGFIL